MKHLVRVAAAPRLTRSRALALPARASLCSSASNLEGNCTGTGQRSPLPSYGKIESSTVYGRPLLHQGFAFHEQKPGSWKILRAPPRLSCFSVLQLRNCSGAQTPDGTTGEAEQAPNQAEEADNTRLEALQKLTSLVEAWINEGAINIEEEEDLASRMQIKLYRSAGLVDDWNFEDWHDPSSLSSKDGKEEAQGARDLEEEGKEKITGLKDKGALPQVDGKRVYGIDQYLPAKVLVEFSEINSFSDVTESDANKFFMLSKDDQERFFAEGLPKSFNKEFEISKMNALLVRKQLLKLINHLKRLTQKELANPTADTPDDLEESKLTEIDDETHVEVKNKTDTKNLSLLAFLEPAFSLSYNQRKKLVRQQRFLDNADLGFKKHLVIDGLSGSGKTFILAMLVQWARSQGWLVCYIPSAKKWTHGALYYKNEVSGLWDTPVQAMSMLEDLLKSHSDILELIPCRVHDPIPLGEGAGIGRVSGPQQVAVREGFTLKNLIQLGIESSQAAVGVVVRLRKELSLVEEVPVLIAIDEFNSWFTFSAYHEAYNEFGRRPIHARELAMVNAFRDMTYGPYMVGAFSHSTSVGKLPKQLPGIPMEAKVFLNRYDFLEASIMLKHYIRQYRPKAKFGKRARRALYMLTNGNAHELRDLALMTSAGTMERLPAGSAAVDDLVAEAVAAA